MSVLRFFVFLYVGAFSCMVLAQDSEKLFGFPVAGVSSKESQTRVKQIYDYKLNVVCHLVTTINSRQRAKEKAAAHKALGWDMSYDYITDRASAIDCVQTKEITRAQQLELAKKYQLELPYYKPVLVYTAQGVNKLDSLQVYRVLALQERGANRGSQKLPSMVGYITHSPTNNYAPSLSFSKIKLKIESSKR